MIVTRFTDSGFGLGNSLEEQLRAKNHGMCNFKGVLSDLEKKTKEVTFAIRLYYSETSSYWDKEHLASPKSSDYVKYHATINLVSENSYRFESMDRSELKMYSNSYKGIIEQIKKGMSERGFKETLSNSNELTQQFSFEFEQSLDTQLNEIEENYWNRGGFDSTSLVESVKKINSNVGIDSKEGEQLLGKLFETVETITGIVSDREKNDFAAGEDL